MSGRFNVRPYPDPDSRACMKRLYLSPDPTNSKMKNVVVIYTRETRSTEYAVDSLGSVHGRSQYYIIASNTKNIR